MDGIKRFATATDYSALYGTGYFAHDPGAASFSKEFAPQVVSEFCKKASIDTIVDVGAGNGTFGNIIGRLGINCIDIDVTFREGEGFIQFDISDCNQSTLESVVHKCRLWTRGEYVVTSFDMAEHIDVEHIPDYVFNLSSLILNEAIISISTRPSSRANKYHSTILPIDTWKYLFSLVGLRATEFEELEKYRSDQQFRSDNQELLVVSLWQKRNIFEEDPSHQHYLRLTRVEGITPSRQEIRDRIEAVLDIASRTAKRRILAETTLPTLTYLISFVQDWSFLRSFLEVWPADRIRVLIRRDFIAVPYADVMEAYLDRVGVVYRRVQTINEAAIALENWSTGRGDLFLTATEGLPTVLHGSASLITLDARKRGMTTVVLQHGALVPEKTMHGAQFFIAMNRKSVLDFEQSCGSLGICTPLNLGAPKHLDSIMAPADPDIIAFRLRSSAKHYRKRLLIGTNLHWLAHKQKGEGVARWLDLAAEAYPDVLFILRPHPDDPHALQDRIFRGRNNVLLLDEMTLMCIDWPVSRVLNGVDGVVSTHSTLILDALVAGKPTAIFPTGISDNRILAAEREWQSSGAVKLSDTQCVEGIIPFEWLEESCVPRSDLRGSYADFIYGLLALLDQGDDPATLKRAVYHVESTFVNSCRDLCLDAHPHSNRQSMSSVISRIALE